MTDDKQHAPSAARRKRLKEREAVEGKNLMKVLDSYPIDKYYGMAERLLTAFHLAVDERRLDDAYVFGLRLATFSIESLPRHCQYNHAHHKRQRAKNARAVDAVLKKMEQVAARMDAEELRLARQRKEALAAKQRQEEAGRQEEANLQKEKANKQQRHQEVLQRQREELQAQRVAEMEQSALEKLKKLSQPEPEREAPNNSSTRLLAQVNTGQGLHTKEAVAKQKAKEAQEAARLKEEQEATLRSGTTSESQSIPKPTRVSPKKPKRSSKTPKAPKESSKTTPKKKTPKEPSKLDPNALAQANQLKEEINKPAAKDYKSEFANFQAQWNSSNKKVAEDPIPKKKDPPTVNQQPKPTLVSAQAYNNSCSSSQRQVQTQSLGTGTVTKQQASHRPDAPTGVIPQQKPSRRSSEAVAKHKKPSPAQRASSQPTLVVATDAPAAPQPVASKEPKKSVSPNAAKSVSPKAALSGLFRMAPKKIKSAKQVAPQEPPTDQGFELKMTDAGPAVVDDFSYHDEAYRAKLTPSEAKTISMLEEAIQLQEKRLQVLESSQERARLRSEAKKRLHNGDRKGALQCLRKKKRINHTIEVVKQAIFNMETQIIMLESAIENREVNQIMQEATDAMASYGNGVRVSEFTDERLGDVLASVGQGDMEYDEEELLSELHEGEEGVAAGGDDHNGLLSLPSAPKTEVIPDELPKDESKAVQKILASLF